MAAAAFALKMVAAVCVAMLLLQSSFGDQPGLACPSSENACRDKCKLKCDSESLAMCEKLCTGVPIGLLGSTCVDKVLAACFAGCLSSCQIPSYP